MFDKELFYKMNATQMKRELEEIVYKRDYSFIGNREIEDIVSSFQLGIKPDNLYAYLTSINERLKKAYHNYLNSEQYKNQEKLLKHSNWKYYLKTGGEELKIYENYIKEIYSYEEKKEYVDFKRRYLAK